MTILTTPGLIAAYIRARGFKGWASFWRTIFVLPGFENDQRPPHGRKRVLLSIK